MTYKTFPTCRHLELKPGGEYAGIVRRAFTELFDEHDPMSLYTFFELLGRVGGYVPDCSLRHSEGSHCVVTESGSGPEGVQTFVTTLLNAPKLETCPSRQPDEGHPERVSDELLLTAVVRSLHPNQTTTSISK